MRLYSRLKRSRKDGCLLHTIKGRVKKGLTQLDQEEKKHLREQEKIESILRTKLNKTS